MCADRKSKASPTGFCGEKRLENPVQIFRRDAGAAVGEHSVALRQRICSELGWLGVDIDALANATDAPLISTATSRVRVAVEPTNEEWIAARYAQRLLGTAAIDPS